MLPDSAMHRDTKIITVMATASSRDDSAGNRKFSVPLIATQRTSSVKIAHTHTHTHTHTERERERVRERDPHTHTHILTPPVSLSAYIKVLVKSEHLANQN